MARFNVMLALVALLLCIAAVGAKTTSTPRRALKDAGEFNFDFSDLYDRFKGDGGVDGVDGGEDGGDSYDFFNKFFSKSDDGGEEDWHVDDFDYSRFFSFKDDFDSEGFKTDLTGAFSSFRDEISSILDRYKSEDGGEDGGR